MNRERYERLRNRSSREEDSERFDKECQRTMTCLIAIVVACFLIVIITLIGMTPPNRRTTVPPTIINIITPTDTVESVSSSSSSTGMSSALSSIESSSSTAASASPIMDPQCTISNVVIGTAVCTKPLNQTISDDSLFHPNITLDLGTCIVPYTDAANNQYISFNNQFNVHHNYVIVQGNGFNMSLPVIAESSNQSYIAPTSIPVSYAADATYTSPDGRFCEVIVTFQLVAETCLCQNSTTSVFNTFCACPVVSQSSSSSTGVQFSSSIAPTSSGNSTVSSSVITATQSSSISISSSESSAVSSAQSSSVTATQSSSIASSIETIMSSSLNNSGNSLETSEFVTSSSS